MAAGNDTQRAFDLYQWNAALNAALLHDYAHLEVALRNALHQELRTFVGSSLSWMAAPTASSLFPNAPTTTRAGNPVDSNEWIRARLHDSRKKFRCDETLAQLNSSTEGRIIADLSFGVWVDILDARFESTLWTPALHKAFSPGVSRRDVHSRLRTLNEVRNRLAHHEPNLDKANAAHRGLFWLCSVLNRDIQTHVRSHSTVAQLLKDKP
jgi:hypothetical protein